ncbi:hypothetical protein [Acinetobacter pittii]|uniref:hypothetical protein n=1 Tax=Acinetobacter pittii TaxID=48296 RepID=UPI002A76158A|nr:hypothetical protein [Acinetobacter pittii]WPP89469.1 hypothetical protein SOI77_05475 [Acinetobacter pittii]
MKKLFLLTILLGLSGCGDNNQGDTSQLDTQTTQLQTTDLAVPTTSNHKLAASSLMMSPAISPLGGWSITNSTTMGASTLIDAAKDTRVSAALVTPNAKQVAEVLRGGAAGVALTIAVDQLLDAVDWVMDSANNQIRYQKKDPIKPPNFPYYYKVAGGLPNYQIYAANKEQLCSRTNAILNTLYSTIKYKFTGITGDTVGLCTFQSTNTQSGIQTDGGIPYSRVQNVNYDPTKPEFTLSLEDVAEQVISNADAGSLDAQVATNAATQNILNDVVQAEPVVQELENNANKNCPSGIINNGSCWVCSRESYTPIRGRVVYAKEVVFGLTKCSVAMNSSQLLTRYKAFSELGSARDAENACWSPSDPDHLDEAIKAKATAAECNTYLGVLGQ